MRTSWLPIVGAIALLAAQPAALPSAAHADTRLHREQSAGHLHQGKSRAAERPFAQDLFRQIPQPRALPPPTRFDLLVNFEFNSDKLTADGARKPRAIRQGAAGPAAQGLEVRDRRTYRRDRRRELQPGPVRNGEPRRSSIISLRWASTRRPLPRTAGARLKPRVADPFSPENRRVESQMVE